MKNRTGKPVRKDDFFDRRQEMAELWHLVERDNVLMLAPRRVGKTSVRQPGPLLFHATLLTPRELDEAFLVRRPELEEVMAQIRSAPVDDSPQHLLILGRRGMGKTLLLHRIARAVDEDRELAACWSSRAGGRRRLTNTLPDK